MLNSIISSAVAELHFLCMQITFFSFFLSACVEAKKNLLSEHYYALFFLNLLLMDYLKFENQSINLETGENYRMTFVTV